MFLPELSIKRPVFMSMVLFSIILFGLIAFKDLGIDLYPDVEFPVVTVISTLPSADPETVETLITDPIEEALSSLDSVKNVRSISAEGVSHIMIEFDMEKDSRAAFQDVQAKLSAIGSQLPSDIQGPVIEKFDIGSLPVLTLLVSGNMSIDDLSRLVDKEVKQPLKRLSEVGQITVAGKRDAKIWLWLDRDKMEARKVTVQDVQLALTSQHVNNTVGKISEDDRDWLVTTKAEYTNPYDFENMVIVDRSGMTTRLRDIAQVEKGLEEEKSLAKMNGISAMALMIGKQSGANTVEVSSRIKKAIKGLQKQLESKGVVLEVAQDNSLFIERSVDEMHFHLFFGGALAVMIVLLFLRNVRSTFVCALALPTAVIGTFAIMSALGFTQNMMTLLALSIAIGLLIDDAIVVQENIMRHVELGKKPKDAAIFGTKEIALAVLATTLSIVAVFVPVAFMRGIVGRFFYQFGLTVSFAVLISMFVSFTLNPLFSARLLKHPKKGKLYKRLEMAFTAMENLYARVLQFSLKFKKSIVVFAIFSFVSAIFIARFLKFEFIPPEDQSEFSIAVETPEGSSFNHTASFVQRIESEVQHFPWIQYIFSSIGSDGLHAANKGSIYVKMLEKEDRSLSQFDAMEIVRGHLNGRIDGATITVEQVQRVSGGEKMTDVQFEIRGHELKTLEDISNQIMTAMKAKSGYFDVSSSSGQGKPQATISINREAASESGLTPHAIAATLRTAIGGLNVVKIRENGDRIDVALRFEEQFRQSPEQILQIQLRNPLGENIPLSRLVTVHKENGPSRIDRCNRTRQITIYANLVRSEKVLGDAIQEINEMFSHIQLPPGYSYYFTGQAESFEESFGHLCFALILAIFLVYMVLAAQFESLLHPFTIMLTLPLSIIGAIGALVICNMTMSIFTMIGIIMLMGLVTKNGILLIDCVQQLRMNMSKHEAILTAGMKRLRPILMTTLAVIFGMLPVALDTGEGSESRAPMAVAVIGGLITSTLLTLIIIPVVYSILDEIHFKKLKFNRFIDWVRIKKGQQRI